jgi:exodeoxyribonuclease V alpha subunit
VEPDSPFRIRATLAHLLEEATGEGHLCLPYPELIQRTGEYLGIARENLEAEVEHLCADGRLAIQPLKRRSPKAGEPAEIPMVFMRHYQQAEASIHLYLERLLAHAKFHVPIDIPRAIEWAEQEAGLSLETSQGEAIAAALEEPVLVITGGPGVGKTTIVRCIARILTMKGFELSLAAPTGRAAKRLSEATGYAASTIHRLLGFNPHNFTFEYDENNPLPCDILIADESSMIDVPLMERLLCALKPQARLILVGDVDQLPSVGPGELLRSMIDCGRFKVVRLTKLFRQEEGSGIVQAAHTVNQGGIPGFITPDEQGEIFFLERNEGEEAAEQVIHLMRDRIPDRFGLDPFKDIQVLTPMHKGSCGTENLNYRLQEALNPEGESIERFGRTFRIGDKVMQIRNNYNLNVFNGDIGTVDSIDRESARMKVLIDDDLITYDFEILDELVHAYCISIHKSQGSEFPAVVIPLLTQHYILLRRNLLYTGITRAKNLLVMVGSKKALRIAVSNARTHRRYSLLEQRLRG